MGSGDNDALLAVEDGGEAFGATEERNFRPFCGAVGGVLGVDGRGVDDELCSFDSGTCLRCEKLQAQLLHAVGFRGGDAVAPGDLVAHGKEQQRETAHARSGNSDEMDSKRLREIGKVLGCWHVGKG